MSHKNSHSDRRIGKEVPLPKSVRDADERRKFTRFPVLDGLIEPITLNWGSARNSKTSQPAILTNLSAGGLSLLVFAEPPRVKRLEMLLTIPGLKGMPIEGQVVRVYEKGQTYSVGISFTRISPQHRTRINSMARDNTDCETRIELNIPEVCVRTCAYHELCLKPQKSPYFWTKK